MSTAAAIVTLPDNILAELAHLGVTPEQFYEMPQITLQLRHIAGVLRGMGIRRRAATPAVTDDDGNVIVDAVPAEPAPLRPVGWNLDSAWPRFLDASEDPDARKVLAAYRSCARGLRARIPIEAFCCAAGVSSTRVLEQLIIQVVRQGANAATVITGLNQPRVVQKTVEMALRDDGTQDRAMFHKASGWTPTPKSAQTNITVTQAVQASSTAQVASVPAPPPESTIRRLSDRFNEAPRLVAPAPNVPVATDAEIVDEEDEGE
jgi:hypothetical protein